MNVVVIVDRAAAHSVREELATTIEDSDHPGTRGRAEIAKELLKREPAFLSVNPVQYCKSCVLHDSVTRVVDEDEGCLPSAVPVLTDPFCKVSKQVIEGIKVFVFIHDNVHRLGAQTHNSFSHVGSVVVDRIEISEAFKARLFAPYIVALVLDDDPLEVNRSDLFLLYLLFHLK